MARPDPGSVYEDLKVRWTRHRAGQASIKQLMTRTNDKSVSDNRSLSRYEIEVNGELAGFSVYQRRGDLLIFTETVIDPSFRGRGIGTRLVSAALADAERRELRVMPRCSFIQDFLRLQPDPRSAVEAWATQQ